MHPKQLAQAFHFPWQEKEKNAKRKMDPPSKISLLSLSIAIVCLFPFCSASREIKNPPIQLKYRNGPLLKGNLTLSLLWYGKFQPIEKTVIRSFINAINSKENPYLKPDVGTWWNKVESYKEKKSSTSSSGEKIRVRIEREVDEYTSLGQGVTLKNLPIFLEKAKAKGPPVDISVIIVSKEIEMVDMCESSCYIHGVLDKQLYIVVHNPEYECPGRCAIPFDGVGPPVPLAFQLPSRNIGADSTLINFASALAEAVTNPYNTGFYSLTTLKSGQNISTGVAKACAGLFAEGGFPGYPGNVRIDSISGGAFNAHGVDVTKFLLPALWDPKTTSCWTTL